LSKKAVKYVLFSLLGILVLLLSLIYAALYNRSVQNWMGSKLTTYLSAQFKTNISIGHIGYEPFGTITLEQVYFGDQRNDTLFYAGKVSFNLGEVNLDSSFFELRNVQVDQGLCKLITYPDKYFNIQVLLDFVNRDTSTSVGPPFHLLMREVHCTRTRFSLTDHTEKPETEGFDPFNQHFFNIDLLASDFHIVQDSLNFNMEKISCRERSGFVLNKLKAHTVLYNKGMFFDDLELITPQSHITNYFSMEYTSYETMADFIDSVQMVGHLKDAHIDMRDIIYFAPVMKDFNRIATVSTDFRGSVADFKLNKLHLKFGAGSKLEGRVSITGMPDLDNAFIDARLKNANTDAGDLSYLLGYTMPGALNELGKMKFEGDFTGFVKDFVAYGAFETRLGKVESDLNMKLRDSINESSYSGNLKLIGFDMGTLTGSNAYVGKTSLNLNVRGKGFDLEHLETWFRADVHELEVNRYKYHSINISGDLKHKMFNGDVVVNDTNLRLNFGGVIDLNKKIPVYQFQSRIDYAFLRNLHLDTANTVLSADIDMNFAIRDIDHNEGYISVNNISYVKNGKDFRIDHAILQSSINGNQRILNLQADELTAKLSGQITLSELGTSLRGVLVQLFPAYYKPVLKPVHYAQQFDFQLRVNNSENLSSLLFPELEMEQFELEGNYRSSDQRIQMNLQAGTLRYKKYTMKNLSSSLNTGSRTGSFRLGAESLLENDTLVLSRWELLTNAKINAADFTFNVNDTANHIRSNSKAHAFFREQDIELLFDSSLLEFRGYPFSISSQSRMVFGRTQIDFDRVRFTNREQHIELNGFYDYQGMHNLKAGLSNIDLSIINAFYRKSDVKYGGVANGELVLKGNAGVSLIDAYLDVKALKLDDDLIGDFYVNSNFNQKQNRFVVYAKSVSGKLKNLEFGGYIETNTWPYTANLNIAFDESPLNAFQAFLKGQVFIFEGTTSARCKLTGRVNNLALSGNIYFNQVKARIEYLKTTYTFATSLSLDNNRIIINSTNLFDENGRSAQLLGEIKHRSFSEFELDIRLENLKRFKILNTTARDNNMYYGTGYASGSLKLYGTLNNLVMDANLRTEQGTQFNIPLMSGGQSDNAMLNFINSDTAVKSSNLLAQTKLYGFSMNIMLEVTPSAEIQIIMDAVNEDKIRGSGRGTLKMELTRQGQFNIYGGVTIVEGDYHFTAVGVYSRKFIIQSGSTILWAGNPLHAILDINGVYRARKTSIANLLPGLTTEQYNLAKAQRVPVECLLVLKGNMLSPDIRFDLNFPDLSSNLGAENVALYNTLALLRNNPDMMNQQVVSLLVFNNFVPINNTTGAGGNLTAGVSNTLSDLVTKQVNKGVEKIIPGLDFNLDVQMSTQQKTQYILSASKKLLNDRLEVQASYDVVTYNNNFMTQYNLRRDGSLRLRAYQKTTTTTTDPTYYKNITTQGIGLYYRKEFDNFAELFRKKQPPPINN